MIVGLISSYSEGSLLAGAVRSLLPACDRVGVFEGPIGDNQMPAKDAVQHIYSLAGKELHIAELRRYADAADKRNVCLAWAKSVQATWAVWLDADEVLLWGEYLRDMIYRAETEGVETGTAIGGFPVRVVELDGSVALATNRIVSTAAVNGYLHDAYQAELVNGMVVALPSEKICGAGGVPYGAFPHDQLPGGELVPVQDPAHPRVQEYLARHRPPVAGEPHILHRAVLRDPSRGARRLSEVEAEWFLDAPDASGRRHA